MAQAYEQTIPERAAPGGGPHQIFGHDLAAHRDIDAPALPPRVMAALLAQRIEFEIDVCDLFDAQLRGSAPPLIDARVGRAHAAGHIAGAVHMTVAGATPDALADLPPAPFVAVYGSDGQRLDAVRVSHAIAELGFAVKIVNGGYAAWVEQGFPVEQPSLSASRIAAL